MRATVLLCLLSITSLLIVGTTGAQDHVVISDIAQMVRKPDLAQDAAIRSGMQAAGVAEEKAQQVLNLGKAQNLPAGLRTDGVGVGGKRAVRAQLQRPQGVQLCR